jgi:hypothetical protein
MEKRRAGLGMTSETRLQTYWDRVSSEFAYLSEMQGPPNIKRVEDTRSVFASHVSHYYSVTPPQPVYTPVELGSSGYFDYRKIFSLSAISFSEIYDLPIGFQRPASKAPWDVAVEKKPCNPMIKDLFAGLSFVESVALLKNVAQVLSQENGRITAAFGANVSTAGYRRKEVKFE